MTLNFGFTADASEEDRQRLILAIQAKGARAVVPLFASEKNPELARLHTAETDDRHTLELLRYLNSSPSIQFAEREVKRKLT